ncbi:flagellar biosynthesis protein FlhA [uncultured Tateyamaria sp.]|uniref:flagellar biosynthesis protein FlhA n=1 Tax=uncultured Tateyamaria sp. TaxID=455651 RepID=UPI00260C220A|nr:flagellar biosynthesis protein FlhA [uncultured Tateyamaria sp.]
MRKDLILVAVVIATLTLMVVPLSQGVIDVLLAINISLSVLLLMVALYLRNPSDFSTFPSVILLGTAFRLALSVGTTRLILSEADAGQIIETFGEFVVSGSIAIGLVIFLIITVVQFLVVTKGAERVAEVGARFALDAMPGKQMSIDAELRAGNIDATEASSRRARLDRDSQFFGAMDGAMKFVKGDAIAGLIIICINLLGGIAVGMSMHGFGFGEAVGVFSLLTVGDGLVAQIPALLMSLCAGVIVTRVANMDNDDLGTDIFKELVSDPRVPGIAAFVVLAIGFIPGFPTLVFAGIGVALFVSMLFLRATIIREARAEGMGHDADEDDADADVELAPASTRIRVIIGTEAAAPMDLTDLEQRISLKMDRLHNARGVRFPRLAVDVNDRHGPKMVAIEIDEVPVFKSVLPTDAVAVRGDIGLSKIMAAQTGTAPDPMDWIDLKGVWVPSANMHVIDGLGYDAVPVEGAVAHLAYRIYERNLGTLFSNEIFMELLAAMHGAEPTAMSEIDEKIERPALHRLLRYLVEDGVPVRPLPLLIGALHYWLYSLDAPKVVNLAEHLRGSMKRQLCHRIAGREGILGIMLLDPNLEATIRRSLQDARRPAGVPEDGLTLPPQVNEAILKQMRDVISEQDSGTRLPALVCAADLRRRFRNYLAMHDIHVPVLATHELASEISTYPVGLLKAPQQEIGGRAQLDPATEMRRTTPMRRRLDKRDTSVPA